jgi:diguanylate cyclase (GGDEF)-like protein/PAS domain S-box-containing protein
MVLDDVKMCPQEMEKSSHLEKHGMRFLKINSFSTRLFLVIFVAVVPLLSLSIYQANQERTNGIQEVRADALHQAQMAADNQQQMVYRVTGTLNAMAAGYRTLVPEPEICASFLADLISKETQYDTLFLLHPDGTLLCSTRPIPTWLPDLEVVGHALETDEILPVPYEGNGQFEVVFLTRVLALDGKAVGVGAALLKPNWIVNQAAELQGSNPGSEMIITDGSGHVLAHYPDVQQNRGANLPASLSDALSSGQETLRGAGLDGKERLYGTQRLPYGLEGVPAYVWIGLPVAEALAGANSDLRMDLLVTGLVLLFGLTIARTSANWLVIRWLRPLITATHKLERGDLTARTGISGDSSELGSLVSAFDHMAAKLERNTSELAETASRYHNLFDRVPVGLYRTSPEGHILDANPTLVGMLGQTNLESLQKINAAALFANPVDRLSWVEEIAEKGELVNREVQLSRLDGEVIWVLDSSRVIRDQKGGVLYYEGSLQDITQRKHDEQAILHANRQLRSVLNSITEAFLILDNHWRFLDVNPVALRDTFGGRLLSELVGKVIWEEYPQAVGSEFYNQYQTALTLNQPVHFEALSNINGRWWEVHAYPTEGHLEIYLREITERKRMDAYILELAYHDPLTGLLNRRAFQEEMDRALSRIRRTGQQMAVLFLDLDGFKGINDRYGHDVGDAVLVGAADRLRRAVRLEDPISRLGGDEFILLAEVDDEEGALKVATRLLALFSDPYQVDNMAVTVSPSIGISLFPVDGEDSETLVRLADKAMYTAKLEGKNRYCFYGSSDSRQAGSTWATTSQ